MVTMIREVAYKNMSLKQHMHLPAIVEHHVERNIVVFGVHSGLDMDSLGVSHNLGVTARCVRDDPIINNQGSKVIFQLTTQYVLLVPIFPLKTMVQVEASVELVLRAVCADRSDLERGVVVDARVLAAALLGAGALHGAGAVWLGIGVGRGGEQDGQHHAQCNHLRCLSARSHC